MYWDSTYYLVLLGALICALASWNVKSTYRKYSDVFSRRGITAQEAAMRILRSAGIYDVRIERISGSLTDHYSPNEKVLRLSDSVYGQTSVAAIGVAAHECGHAIQHKEGYAPLKLRSASVPIANIGSTLAWPMILLGLILGFTGLAQVGVFLFTFVVLFQLITLPVEFNASRRAIAVLEGQNLLMGEELSGAEKVLRAAALTYVASLLSTILQLLRLVLLTQRNRRSD
ncbi:MAG: zinc metallopeptidase [Oscillospiraceae bacterium]|nr:zinc metallopeptidase [Oscillospiraceae bacterium]